MITTEFKTIQVQTSGKLNDDEVRLRIEDNDPYGFGDGMLNLCWLKEKEVGKLIDELQKAKKRLEEKRLRMQEIINNTNFSGLYKEFEEKYNPYPVQMGCYEAFGKARADGLIDEDTYYAAEKYYGRLWNYVGD